MGKDLRVQAGTLLAAWPDLLDPNFMHSVILICDHTDDGAYGLVTNRQSEFTLGELLAENGDYHQAAGILDQLDRTVCARAGTEYPERRLLLVSLAEAFDGAGMIREAQVVRDGLGDMANFTLE